MVQTQPTLQRRAAKGPLGYYFWIFLFPALLIYLVFSILPFIYTLFYSFTDYTDVHVTGLSFVGLKNYVKVLQTPLMQIALKNSVIYALTLHSIQIVLALPLAVVLNMKLKTRNFLRSVFFFPAVFSALIIGYLWNYILSSSNYGLINGLITSMGGQTFNFFTADRALFSVILTQIWQWTGWAMVIFLANLQSIPSELYEAARVDGATGVRTFFSVTLPLMCPSVKIVAVTGLIGGMKVFDIIYSMTSGGPGNSTQTVMMVMMKKGISEGFYSTGAAFGVIFFAFVLVLSGVVTKIFEKWSEKIS
ncbi:MAG: sugar ABC transporter permease [Clostridia bacterium]